ncbi:MAG TPA: glycerol-3-phosphate acyltransferase [Gemmatimonadales bacterium]|nr:glycerol-3-phosphate acyltransferase [Gemmatimonadales bacterium]
MPSLEYVAVILGAYVLGSVPTGAIVARVYRNVDLTKLGSERTGATNTARALGPGAGLIVLVGDFAKGALAVWFAREAIGTDVAAGIAGFFAVVGHTRSLFLAGRGGRGVGTGLGGLAIASTGIFIIAALTGCIVSAVSRYISLGSITGSAAATLAAVVAFAAGMVSAPLAVYIVATALFIIAAHADNIARLRAGTERRVGARVPSARGPSQRPGQP